MRTKLIVSILGLIFFASISFAQERVNQDIEYKAGVPCGDAQWCVHCVQPNGDVSILWPQEVKTAECTNLVYVGSGETIHMGGDSKVTAIFNCQQIDKDGNQVCYVRKEK